MKLNTELIKFRILSLSLCPIIVLQSLFKELKKNQFFVFFLKFTVSEREGEREREKKIKNQLPFYLLKCFKVQNLSNILITVF